MLFAIKAFKHYERKEILNGGSHIGSFGFGVMIELTMILEVICFTFLRP